MALNDTYAQIRENLNRYREQKTQAKQKALAQKVQLSKGKTGPDYNQLIQNSLKKMMGVALNPVGAVANATLFVANKERELLGKAAKPTIEFGKSLVKSTVVRPAVSLGETPVRLLGGDKANIDSPYNIPGLGEVRSYQSEAIREIKQGEKKVAGAIAGQATNVLLDEPLGIAAKGALLAFKPAFLAGSIALKGLMKKPTGEAVETVVKDLASSYQKVAGKGRRLPAEVSRDVTETIIKTQKAFPGDEKILAKEIDKLYERSMKTLNLTEKDIKFARTLDEQLQGVEETMKVARKGSEVTARQYATKTLALDAVQETNIKNLMEVMGLSTKAVKTFDDIIAIANDIGTKPDELLRTISGNEIMNAGEAVAVKSEVKRFSDLITKTSKEIDNLVNVQKALPDSVEVKTLEQQLLRHEESLNAVLKRSVTNATETGRALVAHKILARNNLEPSFWLYRAKKVLGNNRNNTELTETVVKNINEMIKAKDTNALARYVSSLREPSLAEKVVTAWKAGLLTSPTTSLANIGGNTTMAALEQATDIGAAGFDALFSLATGKRTIALTPSTLTARMKSIVTPLRKSPQAMKEYLAAGGVYDSQVLARYDMRQVDFGEGKFGTVMNHYTRFVFNALSMQDKVFAKAAISASFENSARVIAREEGLRGAEKLARVQELLINPTNAMQTEAVNAATYATFQGENWINNFISGGKGKAIGAIGGEKSVGGQSLRLGMEYVFPFVRTPTNIAMRVVDYSPAGFVGSLVKIIRANTKGTFSEAQADIARSLARNLNGTAILALGAMMYRNGVMTGVTPSNKADRDQFYAENKSPMSVLINNRWYQLNRISPLGNLLGAGADIQRISEETTGPARYGQIAGSFGKSFLELGALTGLSGVLGAVQDTERQGGRFINNMASSAIPSVIGRVARTADPTITNAEGPLDAIKAKIPGLSQDTPKYRNVFGEPAAAPGGRFNLIDPFSSRNETRNPVILEAKNIGFKLSLPNQKVRNSAIGELKMTNKEYDRYLQITGNYLQKHMENIIAMPEYQRLTEPQKEAVFSDQIKTIRKQLNKEVLPVLVVSHYNLKDAGYNPQLVMAAHGLISTTEEFKRSNQKRRRQMLVSEIEQLQATYNF